MANTPITDRPEPELRSTPANGAEFAVIDRAATADPAEAADPAASTEPATPIVFLHGGALDHRMWRGQLDAFPDRRVIAFDARGHGWTSAPDGAPFRHCDDVIGVMDALGVDRVALVGLSQGGATAVDAALEHPDRVAAVVSCGAGTSEPEFRDLWMLELLGEWQRAIENGDPEAWIAASMRTVHGPHRGIGDLDAELVTHVEGMVRHTIFTHVARPSGPVIPTPATPVADTWRRLPTVKAPVFGLVGSLDSDDHLRMTRELADAVPNGRLAEIDGAAHYPNLEAPERFNEVVRAFLAGV